MKFYTVGINSSLFIHVASIVGVKIDTVRMNDGIIQFLRFGFVDIGILALRGYSDLGEEDNNQSKKCY